MERCITTKKSTLLAMLCSFSSRKQSSGQRSLVSLILCTMHALLRLGSLKARRLPLASTLLAHPLIVVIALSPDQRVPSQHLTLVCSQKNRHDASGPSGPRRHGGDLVFSYLTKCPTSRITNVIIMPKQKERCQCTRACVRSSPGCNGNTLTRDMVEARTTSGVTCAVAKIGRCLIVL
jgi:hypothetical protein